MRWLEAVEPVRMQRVAVVAPRSLLRDVLVRVAAEGAIDVDRPPPNGPAGALGPAAHRLQRTRPAAAVEPVLAPARPDIDALILNDRMDLLAGEAEVESCMAGAVIRGDVAAVAGWVPAPSLPDLASKIAGAGGGVVQLSSPRGQDPPTLLRSGGRIRRSFTPLVETYATVPYADLDPTLFAGLAYVAMFGMMFGDVGHGALVVVLGLLLRAGRPAALARFRKVWPFVVGSGLAAMMFGLLYGEFFGPTAVVPVLWQAPLEEPVTLLVAALVVGAALLAGAYAVGTVNRWREGGWPLALSAPTGIAGAALFAGLGLIVLSVWYAHAWLVVVGAFLTASGLTLAFTRFLAAVPADAAGPFARVAQAAVELFDSVVRLGTNVVSFARLAAFGLTHAALGLVVWTGTTGLWRRGGLYLLAALAVFLIGNALGFALEALVAGIQALRLEYYEIFSRVFTGEGRPFHPWHVPLDPSYRPRTPATAGQLSGSSS